MTPSTLQLICTFVLSVPLVYLLTGRFARTAASPPADSAAAGTDTAADDSEKDPPQTIMQPPSADVAPPKDDPFTLAQLKEFDGSDPAKPIYVSIKGTVFDVTNKRDMYGPGKSYNIFAGKDGSKGLGKSSLKVEDAVPDYSDLEESDMKVLNDWHGFFLKRYNIVGRVSDLPEAVANH